MQYEYVCKKVFNKLCVIRIFFTPKFKSKLLMILILVIVIYCTLHESCMCSDPGFVMRTHTHTE